MQRAQENSKIIHSYSQRKRENIASMIQEQIIFLKRKYSETNLKIKFEITDLLAEIKISINTKKTSQKIEQKHRDGK